MEFKCRVCNKTKDISLFPKNTSIRNCYLKTCKACRYEMRKRYRSKNPWHDTLTRIKNRCRNSKYYASIKCEITTNELKYLWHRDNAWCMKSPSIDRIDNNGNYNISNCRYIENWENNSRAHKGNKKLVLNIPKMKALYDEGRLLI